MTRNRAVFTWFVTAVALLVVAMCLDLSRAVAYSPDASLGPAATTTTPGVNVRTASRWAWQMGVASAADTNSPAAKQEWPVAANTRRHTIDLTGMVECRSAFQASVAGFAGSKIAPQFSTDGGTSWTYLDGTADGTPIGSAQPQSAYDATGTGAGPSTSAYTAIAAAARTTVLVRWVTSGGDGIVDPTTFYLWLECR